MTEIEYTDIDDNHPNSKYPKLLATIKGEQLASPRTREQWALIAEFEIEGSARDLGYRLGREHQEFRFTVRKVGSSKTRVYARLRDEVTE